MKMAFGHQALVFVSVIHRASSFCDPARGIASVIHRATSSCDPARVPVCNRGDVASAAGAQISAWTPLPAICGEPPSTSSTVSGLGMKFLNDALQSGWAVITVGTIGWNSPPVAGRDPNLFFDQGSPEWNQGNAFWGEQEFTWARQYVAHYANAIDPNGCPPLDVDNDRAGLLRDVTEVIATEGINVRSASTYTDDDGTAYIDTTLEVRTSEQAVRVMAKLERLPYVRSAMRIRGA